MRRLICVLAFGALLAVSSTNALAQGVPVGGCPPGFDLVTVGPKEIDADRNGDFRVCVIALPNGTPVAVVDNTVPQP